MIIETIDDILKDKLQRNVKLVFKNKTYKEGRFILYKYNNYKIELTLKTKTDLKRIEIPIPFKIEKWDEDKTIYFDYRINTLANNNIVLREMLYKLSKDSSSRFYDNIMEIVYE